METAQHPEDAQAVKDLIAIIQREALKEPVSTRDFGRMRSAYLGIEELMNTSLLLNAFRDCDFKIKGRNGVAGSLNISRVGVYGRMDKLGLERDHFKHAPEGASALSILKNSARSNVAKLLGQHHGDEKIAKQRAVPNI